MSYERRKREIKMTNRVIENAMKMTEIHEPPQYVCLAFSACLVGVVFYFCSILIGIYYFKFVVVVS
jgi:hypothetical protein